AVYRTSDGHLHELWWQGGGAVNHSDLTGLMGAEGVAAAGDPWPYYDPANGTNNVSFRDIDNNVRTLFWADGDVKVTAAVSNAQAASDPFAWLDGEQYH